MYNLLRTSISRGKFISISFKSLFLSSLPLNIIQAKRTTKPNIKAIAFDAYTLYDTRSLTDVVEQLYTNKSKEIMIVWRTKQFEYTWLRILTNNYKDFWQVTQDALVYTMEFLKLDLNPENKRILMQAFLDMKFVSEAQLALTQLKEMSLKLAILSNVTPSMLAQAIRNSGLEITFDFVLSTDVIKTYKPKPEAYQLGINAFKLKKEEILFVAFGGWDEAGAKSFGYPTVWMNTGELPIEQLDVKPDFICKNLIELVDYVKMVKE